MANRTPGPWSVVMGSDHDTGLTPADVISPTGYPIAHVPRPDRACGGDACDNARLMAAAPDLYDACTATLAQLDYLRGLWSDEAVTRRLSDQLRAAIARATGQPT